MTELTIGKERTGVLMMYCIRRGESLVFSGDNYYSTRVFIHWKTNPGLTREELFEEATSFYATLKKWSAPEVPMKSRRQGVLFNPMSHVQGDPCDATLDELLAKTAKLPAECSSVEVLMPHGRVNLRYVTPTTPRSIVTLYSRHVNELVIQATAEYMASTLLHPATVAELKPYIAEVCKPW